MTDSPSFSAAAPALGYLYQFRYALLATLRRLREDSAFTIAIETLDDVVFEKSGKATEIVQTKHHQAHAASLTDASPDLWKTIRIWSTLLADGELPHDFSLLLVTTSTAGAGQAASYLCPESLDREKALERLRTTAQTSRSKDNAPAYQAFRRLGNAQQESLISAVTIIPSAPDIEACVQELRRELRFAAPTTKIFSLLERLEGWWFTRAIDSLQGATLRTISSGEVEDAISDLREQFKDDNLPIDADILAASIDQSVYADHVFVHQLKLFKVSTKRIFIAVREYFRAFEQRSRWVREDLLLVGELERYERKLVEEWEIHFLALRDELGDEATEIAKTKAAMTLYNWVETQAAFPIRTGCTEAFVTRGSYHILSDRQSVGWHPNFQERLSELLEGAGRK